MSHRPLVFVSGLTVGDYLLWNWSLNGSHDVLALVSGLSLPPLAVAWLWLAVLSASRLIGRYGRGSSGELARGATPATTRAEATGSAEAAAAGPLEEASSSSGSTGRSSRRLAA